MGLHLVLLYQKSFLFNLLDGVPFTSVSPLFHENPLQPMRRIEVTIVLAVITTYPACLRTIVHKSVKQRTHEVTIWEPFCSITQQDWRLMTPNNLTIAAHNEFVLSIEDATQGKIGVRDFPSFGIWGTFPVQLLITSKRAVRRYSKCAGLFSLWYRMFI